MEALLPQYSGRFLQNVSLGMNEAEGSLGSLPILGVTTSVFNLDNNLPRSRFRNLTLNDVDFGSARYNRLFHCSGRSNV